MAISKARQFLLESMAYGFWGDWEENAQKKQLAANGTSVSQKFQAYWEEQVIEVGETRDVVFMDELDSNDPEALYAEVEKETGVKFDVLVDRDSDGEICGLCISSSRDTAPVTIHNQEELDYVQQKVAEIAGISPSA